MAKNELQEYYQKRGFPLPVYETKQATHEPVITWKTTISVAPINARDSDASLIGTRIPLETYEGVPLKSKMLSQISAAETVLSLIKGPRSPTGGTIHTTKPSVSPPASGSRVPTNIQPSVSSKGSRHSKGASRDSPPPATVARVCPNAVAAFPGRLTDGLSSTEHVGRKGDTILMVDVENIPKIIELLVSRRMIPENFWIYAFVGLHHAQSQAISAIRHPRVIKVFSPSTRKDGTDTCMQMYVGMFLFRETFENYLICTRDHFGGTLVEFIENDNNVHPWKQKRASLVTSLEHIEEYIISRSDGI